MDDVKLLRGESFGWSATVPATDPPVAIGGLPSALRTGESGASSSAGNFDIFSDTIVVGGSSCSLWSGGEGKTDV